MKLLPGELGLSLQLVQPLRLVTHRRQLQITVAAVCVRKRGIDREKGMDRQTGREKRKIEMQRGIDVEKNKEDGADVECVDAGQHSGRGGSSRLRERHCL